MDGSLPGSSVHGIFQARVLEWVAEVTFKYMYVSVGKKKTFNPLKNIKPENLLHTFYRFCGECGV